MYKTNCQQVLETSQVNETSVVRVYLPQLLCTCLVSTGCMDPLHQHLREKILHHQKALQKAYAEISVSSDWSSSTFEQEEEVLDLKNLLHCQQSALVPILHYQLAVDKNGSTMPSTIHWTIFSDVSRTRETSSGTTSSSDTSTEVSDPSSSFDRQISSKQVLQTYRFLMRYPYLQYLSGIWLFNNNLIFWLFFFSEWSSWTGSSMILKASNILCWNFTAPYPWQKWITNLFSQLESDASSTSSTDSSGTINNIFLLLGLFPFQQSLSISSSFSSETSVNNRLLWKLVLQQSVSTSASSGVFSSSTSSESSTISSGTSTESFCSEVSWVHQQYYHQKWIIMMYIFWQVLQTDLLSSKTDQQLEATSSFSLSSSSRNRLFYSILNRSRNGSLTWISSCVDGEGDDTSSLHSISRSLFIFYRRFFWN